MGLLDFLFRRHSPESVVSLAQLREKLRRGHRVILVETLAEHAFRKGHLPGAVNMPRSKVAELAPMLLPDKGADIIVYCKSRT